MILPLIRRKIPMVWIWRRSMGSARRLLPREQRGQLRSIPKKIIVASFAVAFLLSLIGPIVAGGLEITTDTKGWRSRGTLVAKREMQAEVLNLNRFQLFRDTDGSHWQYLKSTVTEGWYLATERGTAYADPKKTSRRVGENMDLSLSISQYKRHDDNAEKYIAFEDTCNPLWYKDFGAVLFQDNMYAIWKVQPDEDEDDASVSALDKDVLSQICNAEMNTMSIMKDNDVCNKGSDGICCPPHSLIFLLRQKLATHESSCDELMDAYTINVQIEFTNELLGCTDEYTQKFNIATKIPGIMEFCSFDYLPNVVDANFGRDGNRKVRYTSSFFNTKSDDIAPLDFYDIYESFDEADGTTVRGVYNVETDEIIHEKTEESQNADVNIALVSLGITIFALLAHSKSPWLTLIGFLQIVTAVPLAYFFYSSITRIKFFPILNLVGLFVASAIGADDIFVATDKWRNARVASPKEATTEDIAEVALPDAAGAMFLTTATTSVAFISTCICPIAPILCFAAYCGLLVTFNYVLNVCVVFPALCLYDIWQQSGSTSRFVDIRNKKKELKINNDEEEEEEADQEDSNSDTSPKKEKKEPKHRIMSFLYNRLHRFRWLILGVCLVSSGISIYYSLQMPLPESMDVRLLPESNSLELHYAWRANLLNKILWRPVTVVYVIFGLDMGDTGTASNPDTLSKLLLDDTFNPSSEKAQLYLRDFCSNFFAEDFVIQTEDCAMNEFEIWLWEQSYSDAPSVAYSENCDGVKALPVQQNNFHPCIIAWSKETDNISVLQEDGKVRVLMITAAVDLDFSSSLDEIAVSWNRFEDFFKDQIAVAPKGVNKFFNASFMWWYWDASVQMTKTAFGSGAITLGFAALIVILSSKSFVLTVLSVATVFFILVTSTATLVGMGWELGFLESICFSILIGISCDFVIHFCHAYKHFTGKVDRQLRTRFAVVDMGPSILAAAVTTIMAASVMLFCTTPFFTKFATILLVTIFYAMIGSFVFYVILIDLFGPAEPTKVFDSCWGCIIGSKVNLKKQSERGSESD